MDDTILAAPQSTGSSGDDPDWRFRPNRTATRRQGEQDSVVNPVHAHWFVNSSTTFSASARSRYNWRVSVPRLPAVTSPASRAHTPDGSVWITTIPVSTACSDSAFDSIATVPSATRSVASATTQLGANPDQTSYSAAIVLDEALEMLPFSVECIYSDNGKEFRGSFKTLCQKHNIPQKFTKSYHPQTNGKAERAIKTIKGMLRTHRFSSREERRRILYAIVRHYNHLRPHQSLGGIAPFTFLKKYIDETKAEIKELKKVLPTLN